MDELESTAVEPEATAEADAGPSAGESLNTELEQIYEAHTSESDAPQQPAPEQQASGQQQAAPDAADAPKPVTAPASWGKDAQQLFAQLPPDLQAQVAKREREREQMMGQAFRAMQQAQALQPVMQGFKDLQPYFQSFRQADGSPLWGNPAAMMKEISDVLAVKSLLFRDPQAGLQAVMQWAQQAGLDLAPSADGQQMDPEALKLRQRLAQLEQDSQRRDAAERERQEAAQRQDAVQRVAYSLNDFAQAKGEDGQPLYPHLLGEHGAAVGEMMGRWMRANAGADGITPELFKSAYEAAIFSVAATRELEMKAREDARVAQFKANSARARKAAGINPRPVKGPDVTPQKPWEEEMNEIWAKYNT